MTAPRAWRIGRIRRFTRNLIVPVDANRRPLLIKYTRDPAEARTEIRGHSMLSSHYRLPTLHAHLRVPGGYLLVYERHAAGTDRGLFLDLLNDPTPAGGDRLTTYLGQLTDTYRNVILKTARLVEPSKVVRKLYWDRAAICGRLDTYYRGRDFAIADRSIDVPISRMADFTFLVNGRPLHLDWSATLNWLRKHFATHEPVWAAVTQGDPTDVNIADPLTWFDYDTAGSNSLLGEFANFAWYTTALGGWLVPLYNPQALADHPATFAQLPSNTPRVDRAQLDRTARSIHLDYRMRLSAARRAAVTTYWRDLVEPVSSQIWPGQDLAELLRPYLAMRILAVYNLADLAPAHRLVVLGRLAECMDPTFSPTAYFPIEEEDKCLSN